MSSAAILLGTLKVNLFQGFLKNESKNSGQPTDLPLIFTNSSRLLMQADQHVSVQMFNVNTGHCEYYNGNTQVTFLL